MKCMFECSKVSNCLYGVECSESKNKLCTIRCSICVFESVCSINKQNRKRGRK